MEAIRSRYAGQLLADMHQGSGGIFDVKVDGELVFSKFKEGRFPANQEILDQIAQRLQKA